MKDPLMTRLDKLTRYRVTVEHEAGIGAYLQFMQRRRGEWVKFEDVKTIIGQHLADALLAQRAKKGDE
jgi:hypothetical protein